MDSELKRALKFMWSSPKVRRACGCSRGYILFFMIVVCAAEAAFFIERNDELEGLLWMGLYSPIIFMFLSSFGNVSLIVSSLGKWVCGSLLTKRGLLKGITVNRFILFAAIFTPGVITRTVLICLGFGDYARMELFLVVWGVVCLISFLSAGSSILFLASFVLAMIPMIWHGCWSFTEGWQIPLWGAVLFFTGCLVLGTVLGQRCLDYAFRKRKCASAIWSKKDLVSMIK
ncbi:MAG: hypothetical protein ACI4QX_05580 [Lachnospiraceae bacterium]